MSPRKKTAPPKRGPGRPPLNPGQGNTVHTAIRIAESHYIELRRVVDEGHGPTLSDAIRWLIEQSSTSRLPKASPSSR